MNKLVIIFLLSPTILFSQIKDVFEVKTQDLLQYEDGHYIKIPANRGINQHDYLVELDSVYTISKVTLDQTISGVEFYGYLNWETQHGNFNLMFVSNSTDQIYLLNHQIRYILIRSSGEMFVPLNLDLDLK